MSITFRKPETNRIISKLRTMLTLVEIDIQDNKLSVFQEQWQKIHVLTNQLLETGMKEINSDLLQASLARIEEKIDDNG